MKVYEQVASLLASQHISVMFGLMGDANMYVSSAFENNGGQFVRVAHEAGAVAMADVYARMSGNVGVASVTHGPGFTNTVTALVEATRFGSPVLLITGDPPAEATHMQRLDIGALCASLGVQHDRIHRRDTVVRDLGRALARVSSTHSPVVLNIPLSLSVQTTTSVGQLGNPVRISSVYQTSDSDLDNALGLIASASRPVVVAGRGAVTSGAESALAALADVLDAPLFTTALARGLFRDHPRHLGIMGSLAHEEATPLLVDSDCIIVFGASLNKYTSLGGELFENTRLVHIDTDATKLGWFSTPDESVVGDARTVAEAMVGQLHDAGLSMRTAWRSRAEQAKVAIRHWVPAHQKSAPGTIDIRVASQLINDLAPDNCCVVSDIGRFVAGCWPFLDRNEPGMFTAMSGFGSIGLGLSGAIGAALSNVSGMTIALIGDGGFMMHASELATAVRNNLPILVLIFNDGAYGAEYHKLVAQGFKPTSAYNNWPDLLAVAAAAGADTYTIAAPDDATGLAAHIDSLTKPLVVDIRLDPTHELPF